MIEFYKLKYSLEPGSSVAAKDEKTFALPPTVKLWPLKAR